MEPFVTTLYPCRRQGFQNLLDRLSLLSGEPLIIACHLPMECGRGSLEALWFANLILQFRRKDELQSSTSQRELRISLPKNHRVLVSTPEKFTNRSRRTGNPVHTCDPAAREVRTCVCTFAP
ncbi:hypothetical protein AVEN_181872-1 [Araneus ventricosus]|uniref:Uncharacterized protein n=1 Tax=Araneus ventricosus TaxID=182803 RepID=A0A4Y1ZV42_ARAVE|nr:hypothetical protein AVEN_109839-1 [Araneus ventricosus]GBL67380.1 hypothetical protein AVEN_119175-1 [Araneus ventricosus]GBL67399.1 hypothetical protein AVEN_127724-1 [Araneus ventricosus]GBL67432.1 hypothetical protein AVEN_181872-1 [Araneus ventricosus]